MDIVRHFTCYRTAIAYDAEDGFAPFIKEQGSDYGRFSDLVTMVGDAVVDQNEGRYWAAIEEHQKVLLRLHEAWTEFLLKDWELDAHTVWDFVGRYGWRRFRFSSRNIHVHLRRDDGDWLVSVIPNYHSKSLERLTDFLAPESRRVIVDAVEMEAILTHGTRKIVDEVLQEKTSGGGESRYILTGSSYNPTFMRVPLGKANSMYHVSDWILPLRSH